MVSWLSYLLKIPYLERQSSYWNGPMTLSQIIGWKITMIIIRITSDTEPQKDGHTSPSRMSYGMSIASFGRKDTVLQRDSLYQYLCINSTTGATYTEYTSVNWVIISSGSAQSFIGPNLTLYQLGQRNKFQSWSRALSRVSQTIICMDFDCCHWLHSRLENITISKWLSSSLFSAVGLPWPIIVNQRALFSSLM